MCWILCAKRRKRCAWSLRYEGLWVSQRGLVIPRVYKWEAPLVAMGWVAGRCGWCWYEQGRAARR
jgi:hypothetical protein